DLQLPPRPKLAQLRVVEVVEAAAAEGADQDEALLPVVLDVHLRLRMDDLGEHGHVLREAARPRRAVAVEHLVGDGGRAADEASASGADDLPLVLEDYPQVPVLLDGGHEGLIRQVARLRLFAEVEELGEREGDQLAPAVEDDAAAEPHRLRPAVLERV